jgi:sugar phosphate isomerase/epimerase
MRDVTLFTGQWADLPLIKVIRKAKEFGYDGLELACWGDHMEIDKADDDYCHNKRALLNKHGMKLFALSTHLVGQAVSDNIDERHKSILPPYIWGDGDPEGVRQRAAKEVIKTGEVAKKLGLKVVNGFTGSPIWHLLYSFPPVSKEMIDKGYEDFARRWKPILDAYQEMDMKFALEVHPSEIAFDIASAERTLEALDNHPAFGFNYDPSHFVYQGVDYVEFIYRFSKKIFHVHVKDAKFSDTATDAGVFGGHLEFGDRRRYWDFVSPGRGDVDFESIIRALNRIGYNGPLSVEWEDSGMDRMHGAAEARDFVAAMDFQPSKIDFDDAFQS